jgi:hypothetical protein
MNNIILYTILLIIIMYVSISNTELFANSRRRPVATTPAATAPAATAPAATAPAATAPAATAPAVTVPAATAPAATAPAATAPAATAPAATEPVATVQTLPAIPTLQFGKSLMSPDIADDDLAILSMPGIKRSMPGFIFKGIKQQPDAPPQIVKTVIPSKYYAGVVINDKYAGTYINNLPNPKWPGKIKKNLSKIIPENAHNNDVYKKNEPDAPERVDIPIIINFCKRDSERGGDHTLLNRTFVFPNQSFVFYTLTNEPTLPDGSPGANIMESMLYVRKRFKELGRTDWSCCRTPGGDPGTTNANYTTHNLLTLSIPTGKLVKIFSWEGDVQVFIEGYYETTLKFKPYVIWLGLIKYENDIPDNTLWFDLAGIG